MSGPTIKDIAREIGVSHSTVSRVLNGKAREFRISEETEQSISSAARTMGYARNRIAQALQSGRTRAIGLWMPSIRDAYYAEVLSAVESRLERDDFELIFSELKMDDRRQPVSPHISNWPVDGILMCDGADWLKIPQRGPKASSPPLVNMGVFIPPGDGCVHVDLYPASVEALELLLRTGHRRIAYVTNAFEFPGMEARRDAYKEAMNRNGLPLEPIVSQSPDRQSSRASVREYLQKRGHPDGLFCVNDDIALAAYRAVLNAGLRVPEDVSVIGCNGLDYLNYLDVPITSIDTRLNTMVDAAWHMLRQNLESPGSPPKRIIIKAELEIRCSVRGASRP